MKPFFKCSILILSTIFICNVYAGRHTPVKHNNSTVSAQIIKVQAAKPEFVIRLQSNPTTGYSWAIKNMDHHLIKINSHQYIPPNRLIPGAGGVEEWHFLAKDAAFTAPKNTRIELIYVRPWEKVPVKEVVYEVKTGQ